VKRRPLADPALEPPARLRHFSPKDWPAEDGDPLDQWRAARREYVRLYGWYPGDPLDELCERVRVSRAYWGGGSGVPGRS
jgi:hypothetical protein